MLSNSIPHIEINWQLKSNLHSVKRQHVSLESQCRLYSMNSSVFTHLAATHNCQHILPEVATQLCVMPELAQQGFPGSLRSSDLSSGGTYVFHVFNTTDAVIWDFVACQADVIPEATLSIRAKPTGRTQEEAGREGGERLVVQCRQY